MKKFSLLFLTIAFGCSLAFSQHPEISAHRGASHRAPENTVAAFEEAWKEKADGTELDVYLTKDGEVVCFHDKTLVRTTGAEGHIEEKTLDELRQLDAGSWKGEEWKGEPIPTLAEALEAIPDGKLVYIELKSDARILPALKKTLDASKKAKEETYIIDFKFDSLVQAKEMFPDYPLAWIVGGRRDPETKKTRYEKITDLAQKAAEAGFVGLSLHYGFDFTSEVVQEVKDMGLRLMVWTVNDPARAVGFANMGLEVVFTDFPELIRDAVEAR